MTDHNALILDLPAENATCALGAKLAPALRPGLSLYLHGDLGAGKTTLVRAMLRSLGHPGRVKSPTYTLVELYTLSRLNLYHFDFYRFRDTHEWRDAGFSDYFGGDHVCVVEWPEQAGGELPEPDLDITLELTGSGTTSRRATLVAHTAAGAKCVASLADWRSPEKSS